MSVVVSDGGDVALGIRGAFGRHSTHSSERNRCHMDTTHSHSLSLLSGESVHAHTIQRDTDTTPMMGQTACTLQQSIFHCTPVHYSSALSRNEHFLRAWQKPGGQESRNRVGGYIYSKQMQLRYKNKRPYYIHRYNKRTDQRTRRCTGSRFGKLCTFGYNNV